MKKVANRVKVAIATTGTGTVTFGAATSTAFETPTEASLADGDVIAYVLVEGNDVEQGFGTVGGGVTTMTRDTVRKSKIAGTVGTTKMTLAGGATLFIAPAAEDLMFDETHGADIASATTTNLETATGAVVDVTGTTTITGITLLEGHERVVRFTGILTLTNGSNLLLPGAANITTAAGDFAIFRGYAAGVVRCTDYSSVSGRPIIAALTAAELAAANTWTGVQGYAETALSYTSGGTTAWDVSVAPVATVVAATGNSTMGAPTNVVAGRFYSLRYTQDTSPRTMAWASNYKFIDGAAPTMSVGSGAIDHILFYGRVSDVLEEVGRAQADA